MNFISYGLNATADAAIITRSPMILWRLRNVFSTTIASGLSDYPWTSISFSQNGYEFVASGGLILSLPTFTNFPLVSWTTIMRCFRRDEHDQSRLNSYNLGTGGASVCVTVKRIKFRKALVRVQCRPTCSRCHHCHKRCTHFKRIADSILEADFSLFSGRSISKKRLSRKYHTELMLIFDFYDL